MNSYILPYRFTNPPKRLQKARMDNIAIIPASLFLQSENYKTLAKRVPVGTPSQSKLRKVLETVAMFLEEDGHLVTTIPADYVAKL
jgi:hypothetical protein